MATTTFAPPTDQAPIDHIRVDPERFPRRAIDPEAYGLQVNGNCLEPEFRHGDVAICSPAAPMERGDFVALWFVDESRLPTLKKLVMPPAQPIGTTRHPQSEIEHAVVVEQLNPPRTVAIRIGALRAMHRVIACYREECVIDVGDGDERAGKATP